MNKLLTLENIQKSFSLPGEKEEKNIHKVILESIDLEVRAGEFLAILGPSGSGKSTLLRIIAGLIPASSGTVSYLGQPIRESTRVPVWYFSPLLCFPG